MLENPGLAGKEPSEESLMSRGPVVGERFHYYELIEFEL